MSGKSALCFGASGWQNHARTACNCRSVSDCVWVAGASFYNAGTIWTSQTTVRKLHATGIARLFWPIPTKCEEKRTSEYRYRCNTETCAEFSHGLAPSSAFQQVADRGASSSM